ncbi:hypothetical protein JCGZ_15747 [Jatropha curcas]|uniref:UspA domain-containing protein n=1 Tax=Jatropha curcas TaxID=180498 RepID=A0A067LA13_JATCU|nr:hypothetical protein JCGZ_15747 [Jatropha curcas]
MEILILASQNSFGVGIPLIKKFIKTKDDIKSDKLERSKEQRAPPRAYELVNSLKNMFQLRRPEIQIEIAVVEGKEKGPLIVEEAKRQGVELLVLGQKKRSMTWRLIMMWASNKVTGGGVVEYCIQNADCMAIAVRRRSKKGGGYLITTKRHKDFWLLA